MELIRNFSGLSKGDANIAGGKGASLGEMTSAGIPVPPGFVVLADAFEKFLEENEIGSDIDNILKKVNHKDTNSVDGASAEIQSIIMNSAMPGDIEAEIQKHFSELDAEYVAVRSSATAEDGTSASWAGELESYLNTDEDILLENVKRCWASLFTPRAIFYRIEKEMHNDFVSVAVVVQKMIESEVSGICFTVHPVTEDHNQMVLEAGYGLGEAIVGGIITPDNYVVDKTEMTITDTYISEQSIQIVRNEQRGTRNEEREGTIEIEVEEKKREQQKLSGEKIIELAKICLNIEHHYGFPCDIEWAYENGVFYIVQSRPITTLQGREIDEPESLKEVWINNFSVGRGSFQIIYPAYNFGFQKGQKSLLGQDSDLVMTRDFGYFKKGLDLQGGYFLEDEVISFVEKIMEVIKNKPAEIEELNLETYKLNDEYFDYSNECLNIDFETLSNSEIEQIHYKITMMQENAHLWGLATTWFVDSHGETFSKWLLEKTDEAVKKVDPEDNSAEIFSDMTTLSKNSLGIEEEIESLKVLEQISKDQNARQIFLELTDYSKIPGELPTEIESAIRSHCEKWRWIPFGYTGPAYEIDYYLTVWSGILRENVNIEAEIKAKVDRPETVRNRHDELSHKFNFDESLLRLFEIGANMAFLKGYRKDCSYHGFYVVDRMFAELAKRFNREKMDFYYLSYEEISDILLGKTEINDEELARRKDCSVIYFDGENCQILSGDEARNFISTKNLKEEEVVDGDGIMRGTVARSGFAKGIVKIINYSEEIGKMNDGNIMVSHTTFPSLVPAMKKASAIITEDGGITCHAAIVARELGTPCITGIKTATKVLKDGDLVEVDADKGIVRRISNEEK